MKVLSGPTMDTLVPKYLEEKLGMDVTSGTPYVAFGVYDRTNEFVAGIIVSNFRGNDCEISMAAETANWARKGVMRIVFEYIFYRARCIRCTCIVPKWKSSARTRRLLGGLNFVLEGNLRRAYDGRTDALIYGLLAEDCRFLSVLPGGKSEQKDRASAASGA